VFFWGHDTVVGTLAGGPGARGDFSMKFKHLFLISGRWGHRFFAKIVLKHARITAECNRAQNFEHVAPLHESWKEWDFSFTYLRHFLGLFPVIHPHEIFLFHFLKI